ncbi:hypothetical protein SBA5_250084 [Candidatus Sulfotelmatomonas gaucii]|uniref:Uncharacterized protein n=1 Tax=Candidatus Sulfuritelmatomonas gaucii TaxID=2043161 RepID=A0A2N9L9X3_9BACT|nr:hypothetical protein SBA5_250084 [Candidatus Sulfotelmatomonas gaucii]
MPRLSAPAITSARRTPGIGRSTTVVTADSHLPSMPFTSSLCRRTSASINGLLPMVPISTTFSPTRAAPFITGASCPVTRPTSWLRSPAARITPGQSSPLTTNGPDRPFTASTKAPDAGDVVTYFGSPKAPATVGHNAIARRTRKVVRADQGRDMSALQVRRRDRAGITDIKKANRPVLIVSLGISDYALHSGRQ